MAVLLYHDDAEHGEVAITEGMIAGERYSHRHYQHQGHFLEVDGPANVVAHDVQEILQLPGYRLATAREQEQRAKEQQKTSSLAEKKRKG